MKIETIYVLVAIWIALAAVLFVIGATLFSAATALLETLDVYQDWKLGRALRLAEGDNRIDALLTIEIRAAQRELRQPLQSFRLIDAPPVAARPNLKIVK